MRELKMYHTHTCENLFIINHQIALSFICDLKGIDIYDEDIQGFILQEISLSWKYWVKPVKMHHLKHCADWLE